MRKKTKPTATANSSELLFDLDHYTTQPSYQPDWAIDIEGEKEKSSEECSLTGNSSELNSDELPGSGVAHLGLGECEELADGGGNSTPNRGQCARSGRIEWHDKIKRLKSGEVKTYSYNVYRWQFDGEGKVYCRTIPTGKLYDVAKAIASGESAEAIAWRFWKVPRNDF